MWCQNLACNRSNWSYEQGRHCTASVRCGESPVPELYEIGDTINENILKKTADTINPVVGKDIIESDLALGGSIEDATVMDTAELLVSYTVGGAAGNLINAGLQAHELLQANKAEKDTEKESMEYPEKEKEEPMPLKNTSSYKNKAPKGSHYMPDGSLMKDSDMEKTKVIEKPPEPKLQHRNPNNQGGGGGSCKPKRKPISCS